MEYDRKKITEGAEIALNFDEIGVSIGITGDRLRDTIIQGEIQFFLKNVIEALEKKEITQEYAFKKINEEFNLNLKKKDLEKFYPDYCMDVYLAYEEGRLKLVKKTKRKRIESGKPADLKEILSEGGSSV